jgi:integrase
VDDATVNTTLRYLNRHVAGLVQFQRLTGCRPDEAMSIRRPDIDVTGSVWLYKPQQHKTKHKGKERVIALGPKAQELVKGFFTDNAADYLFSPARYETERLAERAAKRKTPKFPSHMARNQTKRVGENRKRPPRVRYYRQSYLTAVERACDRAFPLPAELAPKKEASGKKESRREWWERLTDAEKEQVREWWREHRWFPYQLRHTVATEVRKEHGLEAAQVVLGHAHAKVSEIYAKKNQDLAAKVAGEMG